MRAYSFIDEKESIIHEIIEALLKSPHGCKKNARS
jgi:hypothetical protein